MTRRVHLLAKTSGLSFRVEQVRAGYPGAEAWVPEEQWQPIETAPKDGTEFLARRHYRYMRPIVTICHFAEDNRLLVSWDHDDDFDADEWMPLPSAALAALPAPPGGDDEGEG